MPLLARTVATPVSIDIRSGAIESLASMLADGRVSTGGAVAVAVGTGQGEVVGEAVGASLPDAPVMRVEDASMDSALKLIAELRTSSYDAVVGIGGGKTLDVAKYAASMVGLPFVSVATNLSHDGIASPVSVLDSHGRKASFGVHIPIAVVVDLDFVRKSPPEQTRSGIGDVVSNLSAVADWQLAARHQREPIDGLAVTLARSAAEAVVNRTESLDGEAFLTTLAEALFLSGMAMSVAGNSRPCSGGCHEVSHAIDGLFPKTAMHGEQVAVGTMFASFLRADPLLEVIDRCFRLHGLPRVPADLGLSSEQFTEAVLAAPTTRPDRYTIIEHLDLDADEARRRVDAFVDAFGR